MKLNSNLLTYIFAFFTPIETLQIRKVEMRFLKKIESMSVIQQILFANLKNLKLIRTFDSQILVEQIEKTTKDVDTHIKEEIEFIFFLLALNRSKMIVNGKYVIKAGFTKFDSYMLLSILTHTYNLIHPVKNLTLMLIPAYSEGFDTFMSKIETLKTSAIFKLKVLGIANEKVLGECKKILKVCQNIKSFKIKHSLPILFQNDISCFHNLSKLSLTYIMPNKEETTNLATFISTSKNLSEIKITDCDFLKYQNIFFESFKMNPGLTKFYYKNEKNYSIDLSGILRNLTHIKEFHFNKTTLNNNKAQILSFALANENMLESLFLSDNSLKQEGIVYLCQNFLYFNNKLRLLSIVKNEIGDKGTEILCECLKKNETLTSLELIRNNIGIPGAKSIAELIEVNKTILQLNISENKIACLGSKSISEALSFRNSFLKSLNVENNKIEYEGVQAMLNMLTINNTLSYLFLKGNCVIPFENEIENLMDCGRIIKTK
jgi:Ran GTPase-activating protein (RanGAP) involved in mRNA processing and transport